MMRICCAILKGRADPVLIHTTIMTDPQAILPDWLVAGQEDFAATLERLIEFVGCSKYRLAEVAEIDRPYLHRLVNGEKNRPSRQTAIKIGAGLVRLGADILAVDELLLAAGHAPIFLLADVTHHPATKKQADLHTRRT